MLKGQEATCRSARSGFPNQRTRQYMAASDVENGPTLVTNASDDEKSLVKSQRRWDSGDRVSQLEDVLFVDAMVEDGGGILYTGGSSDQSSHRYTGYCILYNVNLDE